MALKTKWLVLWSLWAARLVRQPSLPLRISNGFIRGMIAHDGTHVQYSSIPYASVSWEGRFKGPEPEPKWDGIFDAVDEHVRCYQGKKYLIGQLDCLTANVYTPMNMGPEVLKPVMVFIHGGGFYSGSSVRLIYGPEFIVTKDVILVTVNYRLDILGFACLGIKENPGNAGLKDQVAALKWVKKNIKVFGGDPDNITIFGESAGAASVSLHVLSPMSKGLFNKAILQSGSSLSSWVLQLKPVFIAGLLIKQMGNHSVEPHDIYDFLTTRTPPELFTTRVPRLKNNIIISELLHTPCIEKKIDGEEAFITEAPFETLSKGNYNKVPMIIGFNNEEGYLFTGLENSTVLPNIHLEKSLPKNLRFNAEEKEQIGKKVADMYLKGQPVSEENILNVSRFYTEAFFIYPTAEEISLIAKTSDKPVYSYMFSYGGWRNFLKLTLGPTYWSAPGASHADELFYMFSTLKLPSMFEMNMINRVTTMWTNFAKFSDPTPEVSELLPVKWLPIKEAAPESLHIDTELSTMPLWYNDNLKFWRQIYSKYRRKI